MQEGIPGKTSCDSFTPIPPVLHHLLIPGRGTPRVPSARTSCRHSLLHQREGENRVAALAAEVCEELLKPRVYDGLLR